MTEAFDGTENGEATLSIVEDGVPTLHVETLADGQAAWTYDVFFAAPHLANVPEVAVVDEGTGKDISRNLRSAPHYCMCCMHVEKNCSSLLS